MEEDITVFGKTNFRNRQVKFGIKTDDRRRHSYIVGKTGMGKTVLLENMAIQDIQKGNGVAIVDPHGEFAARMLDFVPKERMNDVIYFNPADLNYPVGFNVIEQVAPEYRHLIASGIMGVFKKIWADLWSARMEYIAHNTILALLECPESTLLGMNRMLADQDYRNEIIKKVQDPTIRSFWTNEFAKFPDRYREEAVAPIQNKIGQFISAPLIRNIIGQEKTSFDIRKVMDEGKILIVNLSKGLIGEDASHLLGALIVTRLQLAAMSRVDVPEDERKDFYLYVDEFQNFATEAFANILSEARKYHLCLTLAHQYITQMDEKVRDAIFGNVGTIITFRIGAADAEFLEKEFLPEFNADDLVNLAKYNIYLKLMIDGVASRSFSAATLAPFPKPEKTYTDKIIKLSREKHGVERKGIDKKIAEWSQAVELAAIAKKKPYEAVCSKCGKKTRVSFKPDGVRPVYCSDCLEKVRAEQSKDKPEEDKNNQQKKPEQKKEDKTQKRKDVDLPGLRKVLSESLDDQDSQEKK